MSNQGARQASVRAITGTEYTYNGDWMALFDQSLIPAGDFNGRFLAWLNTQIPEQKNNLPDAMASYAINVAGVSCWDEVREIGASPALQPLRTVVTQNRTPVGSEMRSGKDSQCFRAGMMFGTDCSEIIISFNNWALEGTGEVDIANTVTVIDASVEIDGFVVPVTFSGGRSITMASGAVDVQSDPIYPHQFPPRVKFSYAEVIDVKGILRVPTGGRIPYSIVRSDAIPNNQAAWFSSATETPSSTDIAGKYTLSGGSFDNRLTGFRPFILGRPLNDAATVSVVAIGDSIAESVNDTGLPIGANAIHGLGFVQRSVRETDGSDLICCINMARSATRSFDVSGGTRVKQFYKYARFGIDEYGTNNMPNIGTSLTALQTSLQLNWSDMRSASIAKIVRTKYLPRCDSTDLWMTEANQTYLANWVPGANPDLMNQWFDAQLALGVVDVVAPMNGVRGSDPFKWRTAIPETVARYTAQDNTHPSGQGHEFLAVDLRPVLRSL